MQDKQQHRVGAGVTYQIAGGEGGGGDATLVVTFIPTRDNVTVSNLRRSCCPEWFPDLLPI
jgi:hypothetical protein